MSAALRSVHGVGLSMEVTVRSPAELGSLLRAEIQKWKDVARAANIKAE